MKPLPSRGLPPRTVFVIVACIVILAAIPIVSFLRTGFGTSGSSIAPVTSVTPPPAIAEAVANLRERIARNPHDIEAYEALAGLYAEAGKSDEALSLEAQAVAAAPADTEIRSTYANQLRAGGNYTDAVKQYTEILRLLPHDPDAHFSRGMVYVQTHQMRLARADLRAFLLTARRDDPRRAEARIALEGAR